MAPGSHPADGVGLGARSLARSLDADVRLRCFEGSGQRARFGSEGDEPGRARDERFSFALGGTVSSEWYNRGPGGTLMLDDQIACVDIGPRQWLEPKERKLWEVGLPCEIREPVPGFVGLYINLRHEELYKEFKRRGRLD